MKDNWSVIPFEKAICKVKYTKKIVNSEYLSQGLFPIISQEDDVISGYWNNKEDVFSVTSPVVIFGDHTRVLKYVDFDFVLGADGVKILLPTKGLDAKFFMYYLNSCKIPSLGYSRHYKLLKELKVPVPPLEEQSRIVEEFDQLSKIIEKKRQQLSELDNLAQSIFYDMFGDPVTNEKGFPKCTVGDIYKFQYGKGNKIPENKGDYPCYGSNGIVGFHTLYNSEDAPIIGHIGAYAGIVNWGTGKHFVTYNGVICKLKDDRFNTVYGYYMLKNQNYMEKVRGGAAQPFVSYDLLESPKTIIPPLNLQQLFAQKIEAIEKEKELIKQSIKETEELFNSRMDYYFG